MVAFFNKTIWNPLKWCLFTTAPMLTSVRVWHEDKSKVTVYLLITLSLTAAFVWKYKWTELTVAFQWTLLGGGWAIFWVKKNEKRFYHKKLQENYLGERNWKLMPRSNIIFFLNTSNHCIWHIHVYRWRQWMNSHQWNKNTERFGLARKKLKEETLAHAPF